MEITWLGTAGFIIRTGERTILIDPFLTRSPDSRPVIDMEPGDIKQADCIFITHGHFDHYIDVPSIAKRTGAKVYCSAQVGKKLVKEGVKKKNVKSIRHAKRISYDSFTAIPYESKHVRFDPALVVTSFARMGTKIPAMFPMSKYPKGQVFSYKFLIEDKTVHHFGSAGSTRTELVNLSRLGRTDILLLPLQGNSRITEIGLQYVEFLKPSVVIPQHFDDFYPPISRKVSLTRFKKALGSACADTEFVKLKPLVKRRF